METDTLSNYKSTINMHLLQETVDKTLKNGTGLHEQNNCDVSDESENVNGCLENEDKEKRDAEWTRECSDSEKKTISKKDDSFDSDVEEEEHVPLNMETTSDIEKSDDDLDECKDQSTNYDSEKEDNSKPHNSNNSLSESLERDVPNGIKETQELEGIMALDTKLDNNSCELELEQEHPRVNEVLRSDGETDVNINEHIELKETEENVNSNEEEKPSTLNDDDKSTQNDKLEDPLENECNESISNKIIDSENDKCKDINDDKSMEQPESEKGKITNDTDEKPENMENQQDFVVEENIEHRKEADTLPSENESGNETKELAVENTDESKSEGTVNLSEDGTKEIAMESETSKEHKNDNETCPLLMQSLTKGNSKECESEDEMDEAYFDPSLLCPDISMEVDEDPVITTNDAPPPPRDGNKSPMLYEPIFSTYVDEMTGAEVSLNLSLEEETLRQETFGDKNPVQFTKVHCTACNVHLGSALDGQGNRFVHPLLKVLICKNCYHFYTSGEFEKDEDGSELYCRWCGQGGQVMCCSNCEMVFCKKCIRINFDRRKLAEIRDSDDWLCFRCNPSQLTFQRIHCAEFMEYVRREMSRVSTLDNATSFMNTDYSQCCNTQKKKASDVPAGEPKKKKRKTATDPDYDPFKDREETESPQPSTSGTSNLPPKPAATPAPQKHPNIVSYVQNQVDSNKSVNVSQPTPNSNTSSFKIGGTTFSPRTSNFNQVRPKYQVVTPLSNNSAARPKVSGPGYIKILPGGIRIPGNAPTPRNVPYTPRQINSNTTQASSTGLASVQQKQNLSAQSKAVRNTTQLASPSMKHEWFEKTVRAAARVNSSLSYTLTQLNRAQANAQSVEALAVVHNKLQEILSTSINSLIQIRKNLRTEFIAGIKNIRFPPAAAKSSSSTVISTQKPSVSTDDDVIFISPPTSPVPPPVTPKTTATTGTAANLPASVSLAKKPTNTSHSTIKGNTATTTSPSVRSSESNSDRPKSFLRVKSLTALQNVPSECITIPDDPLPPPPPLTPIEKAESSDVAEKSEVIENNGENADIVEILDDNNEDGDNKDKESAPVNDITEENPNNTNTEHRLTYNLKEPYSKELNKIMSNLKIVLEKSPTVDKLVELKSNESNNDTSD